MLTRGTFIVNTRELTESNTSGPKAHDRRAEDSREMADLVDEDKRISVARYVTRKNRDGFIVQEYLHL